MNKVAVLSVVVHHTLTNPVRPHVFTKFTFRCSKRDTWESAYWSNLDWIRQGLGQGRFKAYHDLINTAASYITWQKRVTTIQSIGRSLRKSTVTPYINLAFREGLAGMVVTTQGIQTISKSEIMK